MKNKVILFNPRSASGKHRIPNSILQVGSSLEGLFDYIFIDGNLEKDPLGKIEKIIQEESIGFIGMTVMPGPQLKQAIPFVQTLKDNHPEITMIWGGYFAANQYKPVLDSGAIDYVITGPADDMFPQLIQAILDKDNTAIKALPNLIFKENEEFIKTKKHPFQTWQIYLRLLMINWTPIIH